jgi:GNAT superfamily N-acetyltransferase
MNIIIREAVVMDVPEMFSLINELALYEKAPEEVSNTIEKIKDDGFGKNSIYKCYVAELNHQVIGMCLYYTAYSTWKGKYIYLDDLIINEKFRKLGIGKMLFDKLISHCKSENVNQLRWHVLDWNEPAINFYKKYNASLDPEWITGKLSKEQINNY